MFKLWAAACLAALPACAFEHLLRSNGPILKAIYVLGVYGVAYLAATYLMHIRECVELLGKLVRRVGVG